MELNTNNTKDHNQMIVDEIENLTSRLIHTK